VKGRLLILVVLSFLANSAKADTIWTLVDILLVDDYRIIVDTAVYKNKEDCRVAAIAELLKITSREEDIRVHYNTLNEPTLIETMLFSGEGTFSGGSAIHYIKCSPSNPIK